MPTPRALVVILLCTVLLVTSVAAQTDFSGGTFCPDGPGLGLSFILHEPGPVRLVIGRPFTGDPVRILVDDVLAAGQHMAFWDGRDIAGNLLPPGYYTTVLSGDGWAVDSSINVHCGTDLSLQGGTVIDGKNVHLVVALNTVGGEDVDIGIYDASGTTRLGDFYQGTGGEGTLAFLWLFTADGGKLPAGDYVLRMTSQVYDEDIPITIDPYTPLRMATSVIDATGARVEAADYPAPPGQAWGPLQSLSVDFDRRLTPAETDHVLGGGFWRGGFLGQQAVPEAPAVRPDSTGITWTAFARTREWRDVSGVAGLESWGLCEGGQGVVRLGYDHAGITWRDRRCLPRGDVDPSDWVVGPGPFWETPSGSIEPACGNPLLVGDVAELRFFLEEAGVVKIRVVAADGSTVKSLVAADLSAGYHSIVWDRTDHDGNVVSAGIYHVVWDGYRADASRAVASGDILVGDQVAAAPGESITVARPALLGNFPNPFNPTTTVAFSLPSPMRARLTVVSLDGRTVATLADGPYAAGRHEVTWRGRDGAGRPVASGAYLYRLEAGGAATSRRLLLLK